MLQYLNQKRGQSTLEYAILIIIIIAALLSIQVYIKRGVQGRLKSSADDIGDQYSDGNTNSIKTVVRTSNTEESFGISGTGQSSSSILTPESTNTTENSIIINPTQEYWGFTNSSQ
jgi:uncharacterized protein (UPF0333 family)